MIGNWLLWQEHESDGKTNLFIFYTYFLGLLPSLLLCSGDGGGVMTAAAIVIVLIRFIVHMYENCWIHCCFCPCQKHFYPFSDFYFTPTVPYVSSIASLSIYFSISVPLSSWSIWSLIEEVWECLLDSQTCQKSLLAFMCLCMYATRYQITKICQTFSWI